MAWPENIRKQPQITHNEEAAHVIHIQCIVFKNNVNKIKEKCAGKLVTNVISQRENGTSHILCLNFERHFNSARQMKCPEIATRVIVIEAQKPLSVLGIQSKVELMQLHPY